MGALAPLLGEAAASIPAHEARILLAHLLGRPVGELLWATEVGADTAERFKALVVRRQAGEPLQYLTGQAFFRTIQVAVAPGVFIPRPETEVMTGWALERLQELPDHPVVVELCAGSGAISAAIAAESGRARQYAVELSPSAFELALTNLRGTGVDLREGDMAEAFTELDGQVDLVIANPPYIPLTAWEYVAEDVRSHEPDLALFSGPDGLDAMRVVAQVAKRLLRPGGWVCAEHAESQSEAVVEVFAQAGGFTRIIDREDLTARPRFVTAIRAWEMAG